MINNLAPFLNKFKKIENRALVIRKTTKEILKKNFSVAVPVDSIDTRGQIVYIKTSGSAKTEILTQEKDILKKINERLGKETLLKIK